MAPGTCTLDLYSLRHITDMDGPSSSTCACGCGHTLAPRRRPRQYVLGHNRRGCGSSEAWIEQGMRFVWVDGKKRPLHRLIMEEQLGRPLRPDEVVRHRDGDLL